MHRLVAVCLVALATFALGSSLRGQPAPCAEFSTFLSGMTVHYKGLEAASGGVFHLTSFEMLFVPKSSQVDDSGRDLDDANQIWAVLAKADGTELKRMPLHVTLKEGVYSHARTTGVGGPATYSFEEEGDYVLEVRLATETLSRLPFRVRFEGSDDPFEPTRYTYVEGPWSELGYLYQQGGKPESPLVFSYWARRPGNTETTSDTVFVELSHEGEVIADDGRGSSVASPEWTHRAEPLRFRADRGGDIFTFGDLLEKDGDYHIAIRRVPAGASGRGDVEVVYPLTVEGGKIAPHARQSLSYAPRTEFLSPRRMGGDRSGGGFLYWLDARRGAEAASLLETSARTVAGPSAGDLTRWQVVPTLPASQPLRVAVTRSRTRADTHIAAGDGIVAFGTGSNTGVSWLAVGEDEERSVPNGAECSSKVLGVAGKKLVLVRKRSQVVVFDTARESLAEIPETDVSLWREFGGLYRSQMLHVDGYLVATVNDPKNVSDRATIKVVDVSGGEPVIIPIRARDVEPRNVKAVAVGAGCGRVALITDRPSALHVAEVATGAETRSFDLSSADGFGDNRLLFAGRHVIYADSSGKMRAVDTDSGAIVVLGPAARNGTMYSTLGAEYGYATPDGKGSNFTFAFGSCPAAPVEPGEAGDKGEFRGDFGRGGSVAMIGGGRAFIAGTQKGGLSSGKFLQYFDGARWAPVGAAPDFVPAIDVVAGARVIAFKTGTSRDVVVGYAVFGDAIDPR